jgi:hypothetical protein
MRLILVFALLPIIFLFSWASAPFVYVFVRTIHFAERLREIAPIWQHLFFISIIVLVVYCGKSKWFFWLGLVPLLALSTWLGGKL